MAGAATALVPAVVVGSMLWGMAQARLAMARSAVARHAVAGCEQIGKGAIVYRLTLLPRRGALCSAVAHQATYYSYYAGNVVPEHWARLDCEVNTPHDTPYCVERTLDGPGDWIGLAAPPPIEVSRLGRTGVPW